LSDQLAILTAEISQIRQHQEHLSFKNFKSKAYDTKINLSC